MTIKSIPDIEAQAEEALTYLASTDDAIAAARTEKESLERTGKTVVAMVFESTTGAMELRKQTAYSSPQYQDYMERQSKADLEFYEMYYKRMTAQARFEFCRSQIASRRQ